MKQIFSFLIAGCLFAACTSKQDTTNSQPAAVTVSGLLDKTDPKIYWPTADQFLGLFHCEKHPNATFTFRLSAISDKLQNERITHMLPAPQHKQFSLEVEEKKQRSGAIFRFYDVVRNDVDKFYSSNDTSRSLDRSVCGRAIITELQYLAETKIDQSTLVVGSDLREFGDLNTYAMESIDTNTIINWLISLNPNLPSLKGITVLFIFMSRNSDEDKAFSAIAQAYKVYLESKGAVVHIQPNL